jgi:NACHT domain
MTKPSGFPTQERQPDPQPPSVPATAPSLSLYFMLVIISITMIAIAFSIDKPDWPGLLVNLASGLIGAVIILVIVDRRLRASEIQTIQDYATTSSVRFISIFSGEVRATILYATVLSRELYNIRPQPYLVRPSVEGLLDEYSQGFILYGEPGSGKSTLVQAIATRQAEEALRRPKKEQIPIFFRVAQWTEGNLSQQLWGEVSRFSRVPRRIFDGWLAKGRALIILDGIDEWTFEQPEEMVFREIVAFKALYPETALIVTSRDRFLYEWTEAFNNLRLPKVKLPEPTTEELRRLLS